MENRSASASTASTSLDPGKAGSFSRIKNKRRSSHTSIMLSLGGLFASLGCAACCALPIVMASAGLAGAWTLHLQLLAGPYERWWLWGTILLLVLSVVAWARDVRRFRRKDAAGASVLTHAVTPALLMLGIILLGTTLMVEHAGWAVLL